MQPIWEYVANLGDIDVAKYGGFIVYRDTTGVYPPEVEIYEPSEDENGGMMYRFSLNPPRFKTLNAGQWDSSNPKNMHWHREWFAQKDKLESAASTSGITPMELLRDLHSKDPVRRALGYQALIANFGPFEFDQYPVKLTESEAQERYQVGYLQAVR
jgi:hypothetical protein